MTWGITLLARLQRIENLARGALKGNMPVECGDGKQAARRKYSHLEAIARLLDGITPWIEAPKDAGAECNLKRRYAALAREAIIARTLFSIAVQISSSVPS